MLQFNPSLTADPAGLSILIAAVVLVFSLHLYLQGRLRKRLRVVPASPLSSAVVRAAEPVADEPRTNIER